MADAYWSYGDARQPQPQSQSQAISTLVGKRPRTDYDFPGGHDLPNYYPTTERESLHGLGDTETIGESYDRYLRSATIPSYGDARSSKDMSGAVASHHIDDHHTRGIEPFDQSAPAKDRTMELGFRKSEVSLPPDATGTLFVEGLPADCTRREVSHIFRPFVGYKEVRLVSKDSKNRRGDHVLLCFVDFLSPAHAATAMDALQGYQFDEHERDTFYLRLQFARNPGARSGSGHHRKR